MFKGLTPDGKITLSGGQGSFTVQAPTDFEGDEARLAVASVDSDVPMTVIQIPVRRASAPGVSSVRENSMDLYRGQVFANRPGGQATAAEMAEMLRFASENAAAAEATNYRERIDKLAPLE